jgi:hypothetical protein
METRHIEDYFTTRGLPNLNICPFFGIETICEWGALVSGESAPSVVPLTACMEYSSSYAVEFKHK